MSVEVVSRPSLGELQQELDTGTLNKETIIVVGRFSVDYQGRASSKLAEGERILMIKEDGATLIHQASGYKPVNWQPPGTQLRTKLSEGKLEVRIVRRRPREVVLLNFSEVFALVRGRLRDEASLQMHATEAEMQEAIFLNPDLVEEGLKNLRAEKPHEEGFVDILAEDDQGRPVVIEIKRRKANRNDGLQLNKYVKTYRRNNEDVRGVLVAPNISKEADLLLRQLDLEFKSVTPRECSEVLDEKGGVQTELHP